MTKEKINIAELLKDCPEGMELDCVMFDNVTLVEVDFDNYVYPISISVSGERHSLSRYGEWLEDINAKCVIFPKGKTTWEGFHRPFVNGDVIVDKTGAIAIYKQIHNSYEKPIIDFHCRITSKNNGLFHINGIGSLSHCWEIDSARFATEEEKQKLFQAIKDNGYKWNPNTKTLEKLQKFKDGDIVAYDNVSSPSTIFIYRNYNPDWNTSYFVGYSGLTGKFYKDASGALSGYNPNVRFATKEEKKQLFEIIEKNGYKWNAETKTLEKLIEPRFKVGDRIKHINSGKVATVVGVKETHYNLDSKVGISAFTISLQHEWDLVSKFDINTLVPFDKVLVRFCTGDTWNIDFFGYYKKGIYNTNGFQYKQCIPYEGNQHLLGTTDDCSEYYKTWED